jgi:hypothetical protein
MLKINQPFDKRCSCHVHGAVLFNGCCNNVNFVQNNKMMDKIFIQNCYVVCTVGVSVLCDLLVVMCS